MINCSNDTANEKIKSLPLTWLVYGENCMPINLLRRFGLNAPSTPFSSCRSNIEHIEYFEKTRYKDFFNPSFLLKANAFSGECILNISHRSSAPFSQGRHKYYECSHHDPEKNEERYKLENRISRIWKLQASRHPCVLFYNHRSDNGFGNLRGIIESGFNKVAANYGNAKTICITQKIVKTREDRGIIINRCRNQKVIFATFKTQSIWAGSNLDIFFGRVDDDLFCVFFNYLFVTLPELMEIK